MRNYLLVKTPTKAEKHQQMRGIGENTNKGGAIFWNTNKGKLGKLFVGENTNKGGGFFFFSLS